MITGIKSVAEYAIRKWLEHENFVMSCFVLIMNESGTEGRLIDNNGDAIVLAYDSLTKTVYIKD